MKWSDPIRDFARSVNVQSAREHGVHEKRKTAPLTLREPPLKYGFDITLAVRLIIAALLFSAALAFRPAKLWYMFLLALSALIAGYDLIIDSILRVVRLHQYDERILIFLVSLLAFLFLEGYEGAAVMLLYQFGALMKRSVAGGIRNTVTESLSEQAQQTNVLRGGKEFTIGVRDVSVGETVIVDPGDTVAFDGIILKGESAVDMSALTGETAPVQVEAGDALLAGSVNLDAALYLEVRARAGESSAEKVLQLIRPEQSGRGKREKALGKLCSVYTPVMVCLSVLYAVITPLLKRAPFTESLRCALILLLIAGSASFVLSLPVLYHAVIGSAAKRGIIFKNTSAVDQAASVDNIVFEQSGTLTYGRLRVSSVKAAKADPETLLKIAAHACAYSEQPLAKAIVASFKDTIYIELIGEFADCGNDGVCVTVDGVEILVGSTQLLRSKGVFIPDFDMSAEIAWYMSIAGIYAGRIVFADDIKAETGKTIQDLTAAGCALELFTQSIGSENENNFKKLGLTEIQYAAGKNAKEAKLKELETREGRGHSLLYVGSASDSSALFGTSVFSAAMNCLGQEENTRDASILILSEKPSKLAEMLKAAKHANKLTAENIILISLTKLILITLALLGKNMLWIAVLIGICVDLLTILQAKRIWIKKPKKQIR